MGNVGARPGLSSTTVPALVAEIAGRPAIVRTRQEAEIENPPMPSQFIECLCGNSTSYTQRKGRQTRRMNRISRIPSKPSNAHFAIIGVVVAFKILVSNCPVPRGSIQTFSRGSPTGKAAGIRKAKRQLCLRLHSPSRPLGDFGRPV
jgi:hypothetical protein